MTIHLAGERATATQALLAVTAAVFLFEVSLGSELEPFMRRWGTVAPDVWSVFVGRESSPAAMITMVSAMFVHAGWLHLATNMLYLWVFGARVEKAVGGPTFLSLYLAAGIAGGVCQVLAARDLPVPAVGASGAVAGVLGAFMALYSGATMAALAPRLFYGRAVDISAAALLALWLLSQMLTGAMAIVDVSHAQSVGWWAHGGGFATGLLLGSLAVRQRRSHDHRRWTFEHEPAPIQQQPSSEGQSK